MSTQIRRVVTGHDGSGKAIVLSDGPVPTVHSNPIRPGQLSFEVWKTSAMPIPLAIDEPEPTTGPRRLQPPPMGTVFRISVVPPETEATRNLTPEQAQELFRKSGAGEASTYGRGGRHPMMHRTETVDYAVVLEGEITLLLDEGDVNLKAGDVVIQRGTSHAWSNRSGKPVRMLYVLMDGKFDPELAAQFG
jgi:quercetin dioxygenase-like cupin family protein